MGYIRPTAKADYWFKYNGHCYMQTMYTHTHTHTHTHTRTHTHTHIASLFPLAL